MAQPPYVVIPIEPTFRITDWNGRAIEAAQSRGNVVAVADFSDNLMRLESALWPTAAVLQKLCRNPRHEEAFDGQARQLLTERLGFYSDLQSLHSEDAITWSFFGTLSMASPVKRTAFLNWLLKRIELPAERKRLHDWTLAPPYTTPRHSRYGRSWDRLLRSRWQGDYCRWSEMAVRRRIGSGIEWQQITTAASKRILRRRCSSHF